MNEYEKHVRHMCGQDMAYDDQEAIRWAIAEIDRLRAAIRMSQREACAAMLEEIDRLRGEVAELRAANRDIARLLGIWEQFHHGD